MGDDRWSGRVLPLGSGKNSTQAPLIKKFSRQEGRASLILGFVVKKVVDLTCGFK
ncbi:hypothetical protein PXK28_05480 [Phaeobacter gallaeciensis]|jgi:hypothetical protein|nr:hypothetical protein [Phaeobacter gallaeciensis]